MRNKVTMDAVYTKPGYLFRRMQQIAVAIFVEECRAHDLTPVQCDGGRRCFGRAQPANGRAAGNCQDPPAVFELQSAFEQFGDGQFIAGMDLRALG